MDLLETCQLASLTLSTVGTGCRYFIQLQKKFLIYVQEWKNCSWDVDFTGNMVNLIGTFWEIVRFAGLWFTARLWLSMLCTFMVSVKS